MPVRNGRYKDWGKEARIKMAIYKDGQLKACHYSYYNDDRKNYNRPERTIQSMMQRLIHSGKYQDFDSILFFDNQMNYPHDLIDMYVKQKGSLRKVQKQDHQVAKTHYSIET